MLLSPNDEWVKARRTPHNEFVESGLKKLSLNESSNGSKILRQRSKTSLKKGNASSATSGENDS